jgi:hypothetical protein
VPVFTHRNHCHAEEQLPATRVLPFEPNTPQLAGAAHALLARPPAHTPVQGVDWLNRMARLLKHPALSPTPAPKELTAS